MFGQALRIRSAPEPLPSKERGHASPSDFAPIHFRHYDVLPGARLVLCNGTPIDLGSRAFELLVALIRRRGQIVPKAVLMHDVWPSTFVDETNLRTQITSLRKALGRDRDVIKTIPGRGYLFIAEVETSHWSQRIDVELAAQVG